MRTAPLFAGVLALSIGLGAAACGGPAQQAKNARVTPAPLPSGGSWTAVWFNPRFGALHLVEKDGSVMGRWKTAGGDKWGELTGKADGNVVHFQWVEHTIGMVGPTATQQGKGYFVYARPEGEHVLDELKGEWGMEDAEVGNRWDCVKQDKKPDPASIGAQREVGGPGGWE